MIQMNDRQKPITQSDADEMFGIACPECGCDKFLSDEFKRKMTSVTQTHKAKNAIVRRRKCRRCGFVIWTRETVEL